MYRVIVRMLMFRMVYASDVVHVIRTHSGDNLTLITYRTTDEVAAPSESTTTAASKVKHLV